jgi:hypothetical protein
LTLRDFKSNYRNGFTSRYGWVPAPQEITCNVASICYVPNVKFSTRLLKCKDGKAKNQFPAMKRIAVILLSVVLVYGGIASALGNCLRHDDKHEHSVGNHDSYSHASTIRSDLGDIYWPVIHCPSAARRLGPAIQTSSTQLRSYRAATIHAPSFHKPQSLTVASGLWFDAVFRRTASYPDDSGRHLFFSILQI